MLSVQVEFSGTFQCMQSQEHIFGCVFFPKFVTEVTKFRPNGTSSEHIALEHRT